MTTTTRLATTVAAPLDADWRTYAVCATTDGEAFFPVGDNEAARDQTERAKAICRRCPSRSACLSYALDTRQDVGVWGGLSERERRLVHGRSRRAVYDRNETTAVQNIITSRLAEYQQLVAQGLEASRIARELGTNVQTVNNVRQALAEQQAVDQVRQEVNAA